MPARLRLALAAAAVLVLAAPAAARATLTFVRKPLHPVVWAANDDGSAKHRVGPGSSPRISPDGRTVVFLRTGGRKSGYRPDLMVAPVDGSAPPRRLIAGWREIYVFDWSPDSTTIAAVRGPEIHSRELVAFDVAGGAERTVARGYFSGVSFSPGSETIVYGRSGKEFSDQGDLFRAGPLDLTPPPPGPASEALPPFEVARITDDHRSLSPLWGPNDRIVFAKLLGAKQRRYGPKNELFLMDPRGRHVKRLTHTKVDPLLQGLFPLDWSTSGKQLLAEFEGQDTSYAVAVNPRTGRQRALTKDVERGFAGAALSADGRLVLGQTGGFEPGTRHDVVSVPFKGGRARVLAKNAFEPDWSR